MRRVTTLITGALLAGAVAAPTSAEAAPTITVATFPAPGSTAVGFVCEFDTLKPAIEIKFTCGGVQGQNFQQGSVATGSFEADDDGSYGICASLYVRYADDTVDSSSICRSAQPTEL